ncbi:XdhC family protein [Pseudogulbenkiania sp. NH8B]|uniref:XdhC family protein n=1 Tax=Pseudogulbenkiania sp. (strain NH8B) TaxID=748280 RepID=UPI0003083F69|nr:XdhC family protein [Pseudogulbenkiania sp. NH8B]
MNSTDRQVLDAALRWAADGHRFALVTVARTWGSAPRPPGSWMALRDDGQVQGSVSGGCIEADLIERLLREGFASSEPYAVKYGVTQDEARRFGLPCGGAMELVIEPWPDLAALETLSAVVERGELARRTVVMGQEGCTITAASAADSLSWDDHALSTVHGPAWRLLIIGAGQISSYLAPMAQALDYQVFLCDPRSEYAAEWQVPGTRLLPGMPDDVVLELNPDAHTAVVALTHDPKLDDMALLEALKAPAFYVGALGSSLNNRRRRERLLEHFDLTADEVARLHGPVGLPIGSRTPPEIALAVLAEMTAVRNGVWSPDGLRPKRAAAEAGCRAA